MALTPEDQSAGTPGIGQPQVNPAILTVPDAQPWFDRLSYARAWIQSRGQVFGRAGGEAGERSDLNKPQPYNPAAYDTSGNYATPTYQSYVDRPDRGDNAPAATAPAPAQNFPAPYSQAGAPQYTPPDRGGPSDQYPGAPFLALDKDSYDAVKQVMDQAGVPDYVWAPIMAVESGGNPGAVGDNGDSIGLFQLNRRGGQGTNHSIQELLDPATNARLAAPAIAAAYRAAVAAGYTGADLVAQVAARSGHPGGDTNAPMNVNDPRIQNIKNAAVAWLNQVATGVRESGWGAPPAGNTNLYPGGSMQTQYSNSGQPGGRNVNAAPPPDTGGGGPDGGPTGGPDTGPLPGVPSPGGVQAGKPSGSTSAAKPAASGARGGSDVTIDTPFGPVTIPGLGNLFNAGQSVDTLTQSLAHIDMMRVGIVLVGLALVFVALIMLAAEPVADVAKAGVQIAKAV